MRPAQALTDFSQVRRNSGPVADFLAVLGVVVFAALMFGLIWALERV
jgi:type IV secretory pathway VirB2 component (pilin)